MLSILSGHIVNKMRARKNWSREDLLNEVNKNTMLNISLHRLENNMYKPKLSTLKALLGTLDIDLTRFFLPFLEAETTMLYAKRDEIRHLIEHGHTPQSIKHAEKQIAILGTHKSFKTGRNLQLLLSLKVQLYVRLKKPSQEILPLIREAMEITYADFDENNFDPTLMYLEEPTLLHSLALVYAANGALAKAITLLKKVLLGLSNTLIDTESKEKKLTPILLSLSLLLMDDGDYRQAIDVCIDGYHTSCRCDHGKHVPDFLLNLAICLLKLKHLKHCRSLLQCAYFGYALLHKKEQANHVLNIADVMFEINFETYGVESLDLSSVSLKPKTYGKPIVCNSIGDFIYNLRKDVNMSQEQLCRGICSINNLSKIENDTILANIYHLEAMMQRLGRHIGLYLTCFPSLDDFKEREIRDKINTLLTLSKYDEAEKLLGLLENNKGCNESNLKTQFILYARATIIYGKEGGNGKYLDILQKALAATLPKFDEKILSKYRLSYSEIVIVNQLAGYYASQENDKSRKRGLRMYKNLAKSMDTYIVDEDEKVRMYETVLYNYSKFLGISKQYKTALKIVDEGERLAQKHSRLWSLPDFAINRAYNMLELGEKKESLPYFALAFYGSIMFTEYGGVNSAKIILGYAKEHLNIEFNYSADYFPTSLTGSILTGETASS